MQQVHAAGGLDVSHGSDFLSLSLPVCHDPATLQLPNVVPVVGERHPFLEWDQNVTTAQARGLVDRIDASKLEN
jgi:hypothetical protein